MPTKDKIRGTWTGRVVLKGYPIRTKRGFQTKTKASQWEEKEKQSLIQPQDPAYSVFQAADLYLTNCQQRSKKYTCHSKAHIIDQFLSHLEFDPPIIKITTLHVESFLNTLPGKTANRYRRELNTLWLWCIKRGITDTNPVAVVDRYKEEPYRRYVPPAEDIETIKEHATPLEHDIITFAYNTLCRAGELRQCQWDDVDFDRKTITLWTAKRISGNKEDDTLDMTDALYEMLKRRRAHAKTDHVFEKNDEPLTKRWLDTVMPRLCDRANVKRFPIHGIRHHVAALLTYELSLAQISKILRHRRMTTTDIYLRSIVKIETKGIRVLDDLSNRKESKVVPFIRVVK